MHIAIFLDQNPASLGGAQASVMMQKKYLELAGHTVTVVAPRGLAKPAPSVVTYPSWPLTPNREFEFTMQVGRAMRAINAQFASLPKVDVVHVQADNWGALLGNRFARENNLPQVNTLHTNLEHALLKIVGKIAGATMIGALSTAFSWFSKVPNSKPTLNAWKYLGLISANADVIVVPSQHFANLAMKHKVAKEILVLSNGVDDEFANAPLAKKKKLAKTEPVKLLWCGRISHEKRIMQFLEAFDEANVFAEVKIYGSGAQLAEAEKFVAEHSLTSKVKFCGRLTHREMLLEMSKADALVQTSAGFETQGMTVYEAGVMGTPSVICDHNIASDLKSNSYWLVKDESVSALAKALKQAVSDIAAGNPKAIDLRDQMKHSKITQKAIGYYELAIQRHRSK